MSNDTNLPDDFDIIDEDTINMIERVITHPCEDVFDIEPGTTTTMVPAPRHTEMVRAEMYDDKDAEIEEQYQEVYDKAMDAFDDIQTDMEGIEGKYKARNNEVGVQFLNAALSAAKEKARLKEHKDKSIGSSSDPSVTHNNTQINISTSDLIKQFASERNPTNNYIPDVVEDEKEINQSPTNSRTTIKRKKKIEGV